MTWVEPYLSDLGAADADLSDHDSFTEVVPHATFQRLRAEDPVSWCDKADGAGVLVGDARYHDALTVSRDVKRFSSAQGISMDDLAPDELAVRRSMIEMDPPEHTRLRRLVNRGFTRRTVEGFEDRIRKLAVDVIEEALERDEFDFVNDIAKELPMRMLGQLLGIRDDGRRLVELGDALLSQHRPPTSPIIRWASPTPRHSDCSRSAARPPWSCSSTPTSRPSCDARKRRDDVIAKLLAPTTDGDPLTDLEFKNFFTLLIIAGNDTTRYTMTSAMLTLIEHPSLWKAWQDDRSLTETAVDEILRTTTATAHMRRTATVDTHPRGSQDQGRGQGRDLVPVGQPRRGGVRAARSASTSPDPSTTTWRSAAAAPISAWAPGWPGWRSASSSRSFWTGSITSSWPATSPVSGPI